MARLDMLELWLLSMILCAQFRASVVFGRHCLSYKQWLEFAPWIEANNAADRYAAGAVMLRWKMHIQAGQVQGHEWASEM